MLRLVLINLSRQDKDIFFFLAQDLIKDSTVVVKPDGLIENMINSLIIDGV